MRAVVLAVVLPVLGCARPLALPADGPSDVPRDQTRHYTIWLGGSRVGTAIETETWSHDRMHLSRDERLVFLRGDAEVAVATTIDIDASSALVADRVRWTERTGDQTRAAEAVRTARGWTLSTGGTIAASAAMPPVPAELVPLLVRRDHQFSGAVFLPARGFVAGTGTVEPVAPSRLVARLVLDAGAVVEATIDLDGDGAPARVVDGEGVIAIRASAAAAAEQFPAVDLIAATALPITGSDQAGRGARIVLGGNVALPGVPGQRAELTKSGLEVALDPSLAGSLPDDAPSPDRSEDIRLLVRAVRSRITPDLAARPASSRDASSATAGDCTTFALAYAALASQRGIPTRIVTGLRVDGDRLIRHRWAVSWTGARWIAIDAAFGAVPAGGNLIGLAIHDADDAGLVAGEAALTQVHAASWAP
ncbi:MAG: hypothetical protein HOV81_04285 [Kofleriaceae bacterium]|nr:hypothetical protein [Kofleriaceae bacterium]